ncbi:hypothetical protein KKF60_01370 [Patescibacteria group bacterium]|nr:hypothetical protein [Patescibacteria group bacterium]MBU4458535.1 hypothetical protein [Patescibacteria group bacterium]
MEINLKDFGFYMWIAVTGAVFSIFAIIYRPEYIIYGFITFVYGLLANMLIDVIDKVCVKVERDLKFYYKLSVFQFFLMLVWILVMFLI